MTREEAISIMKVIVHMLEEQYDTDRVEDAVEMAIEALEQESQTFKCCTDCKEYDQEKHCCHRYSKVIKDTVAEIEQEPILEKVNKMKSEIADSLEFWDYSPNNNQLARDMLETITNFWGDMSDDEV